MHRIAFSLAVFVFLASPLNHAYAKEEPKIGELLDLYDTGGPEAQELLVVNIFGIAEGLSWANAELRDRGDQQLYCPPANLAITRDQYFSIFREYAEANSWVKSMTAKARGLIILKALQDTFPCR
jgi:hypothetical protein